MPPPATHPLAGRRVLVTRARGQASSLVAALAALGAEPVLLPVIELAPPTTFAALDLALHHLAGFDWLLLTSANAVTALAARLAHLGLRPEVLPRLAAVGPATAAALRSARVGNHPLLPPETPILLPPQAVAESLAEALLPPARQLLAGKGSARFLLVRAEDARELLPETLASAGATLTVAPAYRNLVPPASIPALASLLAGPAGWPHAIPFTSSSSVTHLLALAAAAGRSLPRSIPRVSIGPVTSRTLAEHGLPPHAEADSPDVPSLVAAVVRLLAPHP